MLKNPNVTSDQLIKIIGKLAVEEVKNEVTDNFKEQLALEISQEAGFSALDVSGIFSALKLFRAVAKGDVAGVAKSALAIIGGKILLAALCVIS